MVDFLSLTVEALQGKMCQNSLPSRGGGSVSAKISGGRGRPWGILFGLHKTRHIFLSSGANCAVLRAAVLTQYRRVTDGQTDRQTDGRTDGIAVANTALAMRATEHCARSKKTCVTGCVVCWLQTACDNLLTAVLFIRRVSTVVGCITDPLMWNTAVVGAPETVQLARMFTCTRTTNDAYYILRES